MKNEKEFSGCEVRDLGLIEYDEAYQIQKETVEKVLSGQDEVLFLCEHPTIFTLGRLAHEENILLSSSEIESQGFRYARIDRGGDITLHSPGQLVVYPIFNLQNRGKSLKYFLNKLEEVVIDLLKGFDIVARRFPGQTGVWVGVRKIASIGIGVRRWVSFHGIGININTDLTLFQTIRPCGLDVEMASLSAIVGKPVDMQEVKERIIRLFSKHFSLFVLE